MGFLIEDCFEDNKFVFEYNIVLQYKIKCLPSFKQSGTSRPLPHTNWHSFTSI